MTLRRHSCHRNFHSRLFAIVVSECTYAYRIHIIGPSIWLDNWLVDWNGPIGQSNLWAGSLNTALQNQVVWNHRCNTNEILDCIMVFIIRPSLGKGCHVTWSLNKELYSLLHIYISWTSFSNISAFSSQLPSCSVSLLIVFNSLARKGSQFL